MKDPMVQIELSATDANELLAVLDDAKGDHAAVAYEFGTSAADIDRGHEHDAFIDRITAIIEAAQKGAAEGRSTPLEYEDLAHVWDASGSLWCYSAPSDVWSVREKPTRAAPIAPFSARSYQHLVAHFGPLKRMEGAKE
jgi:hypothetical protein